MDLICRGLQIICAYVQVDNVEKGGGGKGRIKKREDDGRELVKTYLDHASVIRY